MTWKRSKWRPFDPVRSQRWSWKARLYWRLFNNDSWADSEIDVSFDDALAQVWERHELAKRDDSEGSP